jgi:hypothetical protein
MGSVESSLINDDVVVLEANENLLQVDYINQLAKFRSDH